MNKRYARTPSGGFGCFLGRHARFSLPSPLVTVAAVAAAVISLLAAEPRAAAEPKRVGVPKFQGPAEGASRNKVMKAVKANGFQVVGAQQIAKTAASLKVHLDTNDDFRAVARELGIGAFVTGEVTKKKATLTVRNGSDGAVAAEASWSGPNPRKLAAAVEKNFWRRLGASIERGKPPSGAKKAAVAEEAAASEEGADEGGAAEEAEEKPKAVATREKEKPKAKEPDEEERKPAEKPRKPPTHEPDEEEEGGGGGLSAVEATFSPRFFRRDLGYTNNIYGDVRPYKSQGGAPVLAFGADIYPAAFGGGGGFIGNLGVTGGVEYLLPVVKTTTSAGVYQTYGLAYSVGAKVRIPLGVAEVYPTVAFGNQIFQLVPPAGAPSVLPKTAYQFVRIGASFRYKISPQLWAGANAAYLQVLSAGQLGQACMPGTSDLSQVPADSCYFPKAKGMGVEVGATVAYRLSPSFDIRAGVDLRRFGFDFHVTPADYNAFYKVAGGAVDQYLMIWAGASFILDGGHGGGGSGAEEAPAHRGKAHPAKKSSDEESEEKSDEKDEEK